MIQFENSYSKLPERFYERVGPANFPDPQLILFNHDLAEELQIQANDIADDELASIFTGQKILEGSEPLAQAYAGFQFGHPVPQLGDGRAHLLGETQGFDIQLKGSGQTRFSRNGDGRSALGPVIREYIVSEAMHHLGVPTTRALAAVRTGETVYRQDGPEPGGVFTRVASSHLRVGTFQYFAFQQDWEGMEALFNYTLHRHYPDLVKIENPADRCMAFLKALAERQAELVAQWTSLGFIHGVMNTDNYSIAGITIDYGPCAFMEEFNFNKVFSSIDHRGRYAFFNQVPIAQWNLLRLADCLLPFIDDDKAKAIARVEQELEQNFELFHLKRMQKLAEKFGIADYQPEDEAMVLKFLEYLQNNELDFTLSFRNLPELHHGQSDFYPSSNELKEFKQQWLDRVKSVDHLNSVNPLYIPRNHQVERAIQASYQGDDTVFKEMVELLNRPFDFNSELDQYAMPAKPQERVTETFCGT